MGAVGVRLPVDGELRGQRQSPAVSGKELAADTAGRQAAVIGELARLENAGRARDDARREAGRRPGRAAVAPKAGAACGPSHEGPHRLSVAESPSIVARRRKLPRSISPAKRSSISEFSIGPASFKRYSSSSPQCRGPCVHPPDDVDRSMWPVRPTVSAVETGSSHLLGAFMPPSRPRGQVSLLDGVGLRRFSTTGSSSYLNPSGRGRAVPGRRRSGGGSSGRRLVRPPQASSHPAHPRPPGRARRR